MSRSLIISNFILFQIGWFACVLGGANQLAWAGSLIAAVVIAIHIQRAKVSGAEAMLVLAALAIGIIFESILTLSSMAQYTSGIVVTGLAPHWMVMMWGLFATTINTSMRWVKGLPLWATVLTGAVLAPLSYLAGNRLEAVTFSDTATALLCIGAGWAILFPLLIAIAKHYNGYADDSSAATNSRGFANV